MSQAADTTVQHSIVIVGAGIKVPHQLTLEAVGVLKQASEIWTNLAEPEHRELTKIVGRQVSSLWPFFRPDRLRIDNYRAIVAHLVERAKVSSTVAYLTQGHPLVLDRVTSELIDQSGHDGGVPVHVMPGVSSIDTILADIRFEPARGLQVFDATNFVRLEIVADTHVGLLLLQPGVFGIDTPRLTADAAAPDLIPLRDALFKAYEPDHPAILIKSATASAVQRRVPSTINELPNVSPSVLMSSTLWIPPLSFP